MGAEQSTPAAADGEPAAAQPQAQPQQAAEGGGSGPSALVLCGPSGVGKGTLIKRLMESGGGTKFTFSVSHTTRKPRPGEVDGQHYNFTTREAMEADIAAGLFLESAQVHGNLYGTSRAAVLDTLAAGKVALLDVDVQGARQMRAAGIPALFVFIAPPSLEELERRLVGRGTETPNTMGARMAAARAEISSLNERGLFDYLLLNDDLDATAGELEHIAQRALAGLPAEPGQVPDEVRFEEDDEPDQQQQQQQPDAAGTFPSSNAAAAAAAGVAAAALPLGSLHVSSTPKAADAEALTGGVGGAPAGALQGGGQAAAAATSAAVGASPSGRNVLGGAAAAPHAGTPAAAAAASTPGGLAVWRGKVAVVTGASSGIGWAVCEALGRAGLRVVAVARRRERLQELQRVMEGPGVGVPPGAFLPVVCDVTKEAEVNALPAIIAEHWPGGGIDVLVNNAGLSRNGSSLFDGRVSCWLEMVSTNILGTAMMTRAALQDMQRRGSWGHIINNVGLSGHRIPDAAAGGTFFSATKFAVKTLTEGLRQEARAKGLPLRVSGISPGLVQTEFFKVRAFGDEAAAAAVTRSMQCLQPSDVADAVVWCLSAPAHMEVNDIVIRPTQQAI